MLRIQFLIILLAAGCSFYSQNDVDAMRYSRYGLNGSARFVGLGGAFGAVGADMSCGAYNPAGLGLYRKNEISFSGGIKTTNNQGIINGTSSNLTNAAFTFNNFGVLFSWTAANDKESRHAFAFVNSQTQNFTNKIRMSSYTNNSSIAKDWLNEANTAGTVGNLNSSYEGLAYDQYILDTVNNKFFSYVDLKRTVLQTRDIVTSGKVNDRNFSYAYSFKDQFYFGASIGFPRVDYTSTTTHAERDDKDSMRITPTDTIGNFNSTYHDPLPGYYPDKLGFNSLSYVEYFKTTGSGLNLKLGGIARINDYVRVGLYYHTPTIYTLKDVYYNSLTTTFDKNTNSPSTSTYPADGGYFNYKIITPSRISFNAAFIIKKLSVIGIDYELVNYKNASLSSNDVNDFAGVNAVIKSKYKTGQNLRVGTEFNLKPIMLRFGYNMQGSPFGKTFTGNFVRNSFSVGAGFRTKGGFFVDLVWVKTLTTEDYYLFTTLDNKASLKYNATNLSATIGFKF